MKRVSTPVLFFIVWLMVWFCCPRMAHAEGVISGQFRDIRTTFVSGEWEYYATGYVWHLPWQYSPAERHQLNERAWGGGIGRSFINQRGDKSSLFLMAFQDSHRDTQFSGGFMWNRYWSLTKAVDVSLGYSIFMFSRSDLVNNLPIPALLPCVAIRFGRGELIGYYCPHINERVPGDVFFIFARIRL